MIQFDTLTQDFEALEGKIVPNYYQEEIDKEYQQISFIIRLMTLEEHDKDDKRIFQDFTKKTGCKLGTGKDGISYLRFPKNMKLGQLKIEQIYTKEQIEKEIKKVKMSSLTTMIKAREIMNLEEKKRFLTVERGGHCHDDAYEYCFYHKDSELVTSLIYNTTGEDAVIHSYVEMDGFIYDLANNLKLKKEDYLRYFGVQELKRISNDQVVEFRNFIADRIDYFKEKEMSFKVFCLFPEEYKNYLEQEYQNNYAYQKKI